MSLPLGLPILYGLADELGLEASDLRQFVIDGAASKRTVSRTDRDLEMVLVSNEATNKTTLQLAATGDGGGGDIVEVRFEVAAYGLVPHSNREDVVGFDFAATTSGADDDGTVIIEVDGILPDSRKLEFAISGHGTIELPMLTASASIKFKCTNISGSIVTVRFSGTMKRPGNETAERAREGLMKRGIPVGKAHHVFAGLAQSAADEGKQAAAEVAAALPKVAAAGAGGSGPAFAAQVLQNLVPASGKLAAKVLNKTGIGDAISQGANKLAASAWERLTGEDGSHFARKKKALPITKVFGGRKGSK